MGNAYLAHHGVPGMKWGVRNDETLRKYAGPKGRKHKNAERTYPNSPYSPKRDAKIDRAVDRLVANYVRSIDLVANNGKLPVTQRLRNNSAAQKYAKATQDPAYKRFRKALYSLKNDPEAVPLYEKRLSEIKTRAYYDAEFIRRGQGRVSDILKKHVGRPDVY